MRCYLGENYIPFSIPTENRSTSVKVTSDITEVARTVQILLYITHGDDVIGKTNRVELKVFATKAGTPLAPREEFDETIRQQRATIAEHEETISDQAEIIQANERTISGLNSQVDELTAENARLESQHSTDLNAIEALSTRREPINLQAKVVSPETTNQLIEPDNGKDGLSSVTVLATGDRFVPVAQHNAQIEDLSEQIQTLSTTNSKLNYGIGEILGEQDLKMSDKYIYDDLFDGTYTVEGQLEDDVFYDSDDNVVVDSSNNILIPSTGEAYSSSYTGSELDDFVDGVNEILQRIGAINS